jgi:MFS family permease
MPNKPTTFLLNFGHALDHMFLLVFATAVTSVAQDFGVSHWEDLMPYSVAAFFFFGLGSLPSGRLGDLWGRRQMMIVFFVGIGVAALLVALTQTPTQLAWALALLGCFASIYHPVGIPMLVQGAKRAGWTIGVNGLSGNMGLALAAVVTGFFVKYFGWRLAFVIPGLISIACGVLFARYAAKETSSPAKKPRAPSSAPASMSVASLLMIMTVASTTGSLVFNFSTSSNYELLSSKFAQISQDPAYIGLALALVYALSSCTQLLVGHLLDQMPLRKLYLLVISIQLVTLLLANFSEGWVFYLVLLLFMASVFGAVPFTDAMLVRYVDDTMRSRVAGMRLAVALGASSLAVWLIGPIVKAAGFSTLIWVMLATACLTMVVVSFLPKGPVEA